MAIRKEFQEFAAKWKAAGADGKVTLDELGEIAVESLDVIAPVWDALDPANPEAVAALKAEAVDVVEEIIDGLPDGRFLTRSAAKAGANLAVPWLVESAAKAGQPLRSFVTEKVGPLTRQGENFFHAINVAIGA